QIFFPKHTSVGLSQRSAPRSLCLPRPSRGGNPFHRSLRLPELLPLFGAVMLVFASQEAARAAQVPASCRLSAPSPTRVLLRGAPYLERPGARSGTRPSRRSTQEDRPPHVRPNRLENVHRNP